MKRLRTWVMVGCTSTVLAMAFVNCGRFDVVGEEKTSSSSGGGGWVGRPIDRFTVEPPTLLKGREGYSFLLDQYLNKHCAACHDEAAFFTNLPMAAKDFETSYQTALFIDKAGFLDSVSDNKFCVPKGSCNLSKDGEVYQAIAQWLDNRYD